MWNTKQRPLVMPKCNTHHCHRLLEANELSIEVFDFIIDIFMFEVLLIDILTT